MAPPYVLLRTQCSSAPSGILRVLAAVWPREGGGASHFPPGGRTEAAMRILIADDETIIRLDLRGMLEAAGYEVQEARDGAEAVSLADSWEPDLVLLDVKMPVLDGIEAARRITATRPVPVVLLTAYTQRGLVDRAVG